MRGARILRTIASDPIVRVALVAVVVSAFLVVAQVAAQPQRCCAGKHPYSSVYDRQLSKIDMVLVAGDGQAFGTLAQDPLLQRTGTIEGGAREYSYRAQRPLWAALAWLGSGGQPGLVGWALAVLTILSAGAAVAATGLLLRLRGASPWWALAVLVAGIESILELTPELFAFALAAFALVAWQRRRPVPATLLFCAAALTRESMLVLVGALALWTLLIELPRWSWRHVAPLALPVVCYGAWSLVLQLRIGYLPNNSSSRLGVPAAGFLDALRAGGQTQTLVLWVAIGLVLVVAAALLAPTDVLTWIAAAYAAFGALFGPNVWLANYGYLRALLPLFVCGLVVMAPAIEEMVRQLARSRASVDSQ
jgi:hypothetical protein